MMLLWSGWTVADFYPRPPRGGRRLVRGRQHRGKLISIHALREEGDPSPRFARGGAQGFLSTPSARRATGVGKRHVGRINISIHALREEGDNGFRKVLYWSKEFLSTPSARRATRVRRTYRRCCPISIHALREEGDRAGMRMRTCFLISIHALREEGDD